MTQDNEHVFAEEEQGYQPWYRDPANSHPFNLVRKFSSQREDASTFKSLAIFPWKNDSLSTLWKGVLNTEDCVDAWKKMISEYWDAVAVGSDYGLYVFFTHKKKPPLCVKLPEDNQMLLDADSMRVAWGLSHHAPFEPVVIFSRGSVAYIYSIVRGGMAGYIRGHGGAITSIAVHPTTAHLFCTTSRDHTTRIYDLTLLIIEAKKKDKGKKKKEDKVSNPHWPPSKVPSFAGAPHGLHLRPSELEDEGRGIGRCIAVLMGGRSGGHCAAVLGAVFHPIYPLLATCGMDRCAKIWPVRSTSPNQIKREDKPVFTSSRIHKARILSISWLQDDLLLTHSAPATMRKYPNDIHNKETYVEAGELIIWRWLGVDRFFPPGYENAPPTVLRGCSSDYQESSSFKLISIHRFPDVASQYIAPNLSLFQSPTHDPLIISIYPGTKDFLMLNLSHLSPKKPPPFPLDLETIKERSNAAAGASLTRATEDLHISSGSGTGTGTHTPEVVDDDGNEYVNVDRATPEIQEIDTSPVFNGREEVVPPPLNGWKIGIEDEANNGTALMHCALGTGGRIIVGVGSKSTLWVWRFDK